MNRNITYSRYLLDYGPAFNFIIEYKQRNGKKSLPWSKAYGNIKQRCTNPRATRYCAYGGRGIRCLVKPSDLRTAFFRDRAWLLKWPSVDRIDPRLSYTPNNIRWVEMSDNAKWRGVNHPMFSASFGKLRDSIIAHAKNNGWTGYLLRHGLQTIISQIDLDKTTANLLY